MDKGIVYLIQPAELIGSNKYKVGYSGKNKLDRCSKGYKNNSDFIQICTCIAPYQLETKIIKQFNKKFKLIAGNEFFEGDETEMTDEFNRIVKEHKVLYNSLEDSDNLTENNHYKNDGKIKKFKNFRQYEKYSTISLITELYSDVCRCNLSAFGNLCDFFYNSINGIRSDKILNIHGDSDFLEILNFFQKLIIGELYTFTGTNFNSFGKQFSYISGKVLIVIDNDMHYTYSQMQNIETKLKNIISLNKFDDGINNLSNLVIIDNHNVFDKYENNDIFFTLNLDGYVISNNLGEIIDNVNVADCTKSFLMQYRNFEIKSKKEIMYQNIVYEMYVLHLKKKHIFDTTHASFSQFCDEFKLFCPDISNFNIELFIITYKKFLKTINYQKKKKLRYTDDSIDLTNIMLLKSKIVNIKDICDLIINFIRDIYLLKKRTIFMTYLEFFNEFLIYVKIFYPNIIIKGKTKMIDDFKKILGKESIVKSKQHKKKYIVNIKFKTLKSLYDANSWLTALDVYDIETYNEPKNSLLVKEKAKKRGKLDD